MSEQLDNAGMSLMSRFGPNVQAASISDYGDTRAGLTLHQRHSATVS